MATNLKHLERHPATKDYPAPFSCQDCGTEMVQIGGSSKGYWWWFQCPFCGLLVQTDVAAMGMHVTLDRAEAEKRMDYRLHDDVFIATDGYTITWPSTERCRACRGEFSALATRTWQQQEETFLVETRKERSTQGKKPKRYKEGGVALNPCQCDPADIVETQESLEMLLHGLPSTPKLELLVPAFHPHVAFHFLNYLINGYNQPQPHDVNFVLEKLRSVLDKTGFPLNQPCMYAWNAHRNIGHIWPIFQNGIDKWCLLEVRSTQ